MTEITFFRSLLTQSVNAAIRAGAAIMEIYNRNEECKVERLKSDKTPLIAADRAAHIAIKEALGKSRIPILSEEGREMEYHERQSWEMFWLVDPLDGTVEFINRSGEFTVNIALIYNGEVVSSVIYAPSLRRLHFAGVRYGAYRLDDVAAVADSRLTYHTIMASAVRLPIVTQCNDRQRVAVTRSHKNSATYEHLDRLRSEGCDFDVIEQGSSYKFCLLAEGVVDYYVRTSDTYEWDTAAGSLILSEAGGVVTALGGGDFGFNRADLRNPHFFAKSAKSLID
ncbi:MAG: 3'(2'),5'-bisphosphate nucleotidase CysQ [Rikenellaceae bacterium]